MKNYLKKREREGRIGVWNTSKKKKISRKSLPSPSSFHNSLSLSLSLTCVSLALGSHSHNLTSLSRYRSLFWRPRSTRFVPPSLLLGSGSIRRAGDGAKFGVYAPSGLPADGAAPFVQESSVVKPKRKNRGTDRVQGPALCYAATSASPPPWSRWFLFAFHHF